MIERGTSSVYRLVCMRAEGMEWAEACRIVYSHPLSQKMAARIMEANFPDPVDPEAVTQKQMTILFSQLPWLSRLCHYHDPRHQSV